MLVVKLTAVLKARSAGTAAKVLRVEREHVLQPLDEVGDEHARGR